METTTVKNQMPSQTLPLALLKAEFVRRANKNERYSLRRYAQYLGLAPGRLSELLSGKRPLTSKMADRLFVRLGLSPEERAAALRQPQQSPEVRFQHLSDDTFTAIADWKHYALLSLMRTKDFDPTSRAIASRLGISVIEAQETIERLVRLNLIQGNGRTLTRSKFDLQTSQDVESAALKHSHAQSLEQAIRALTEVPLEQRDITSQTMAIDPANISAAKREIQRFHDAMSLLLERGNRTEVFNLNVQLVPLTRIKKSVLKRKG